MAEQSDSTESDIYTVWPIICLAVMLSRIACLGTSRFTERKKKREKERRRGEKKEKKEREREKKKIVLAV